MLSGVLLSDELADEVALFLRPEHCYSNANRLILESAWALREAGTPVDQVSVAGWLRVHGKLDQIGGVAYLAQVVDATPAVANVESHAKRLVELWRQRQLIQACQFTAAEGYANVLDVQGYIDQHEQKVFAIAHTSDRTAIVPVKDVMVESFAIISAASQSGGGVSGIATGFTEIDRKTTGMHPGEEWIVAGRPGMGKSSFALGVALNVARPRPQSFATGPMGEELPPDAGEGVAFFSLEMPKEQLGMRLLATEAQVDLGRIRSGQPREDDWSKLTEASARIGRMPIWIDDTPAITLLEVRAKVRRLQAELKRAPEGQASSLGLVVIDYLQLMQGPRDAGSREQEVSALSRGMKQLAKELRVPVMAMSQLNRSVETRTTKDKRPQLSDLRESGAIEQDADTILFIYRDEYYFKESVDRGIAEIIIAKQRNGPTGVVKTKFTSEYTRFDNLTSGEYDEFDDYSDAPQVDEAPRGGY